MQQHGSQPESTRESHGPSASQTRPSRAPSPADRLELLDLLLRASNDGIVDWNLETNEEQYSPRWAFLFGFDDEDLVGRPLSWRELVHPDDLGEAEQQLSDHLHQDWPFVTVLRMRHRHGGYRTILCRGAAQRDASDRPTRMVIIFSDVSDRTELEDRQRALASALPDTVFRVSSDGTILEVKCGDDHAESPFRRLAMGETLKSTLPERLARQLESALAMRAPGGTPGRSIEVTTPRAPAGSLHHEVRLVQSGRDEWVCIVRDVTAQHALADELGRTQKLGAIGQLASGVAHEINTPMQYIGDNITFAQGAVEELLTLLDRLKGVLQALPGNAEPLAAVAEAEAAADLPYVRRELPLALVRSLDGVGRVAHIVRALKTFAHPGGQDFSAVDLKSLLEATAAVATNEWKYVAELSVKVEPDLPPVTCAGSEISQVVLNLVINAAHAIGEKLAGTADKGRIAIEARQLGENVQISVRDSGTGIPEQARSKVFEPFFTTKEVGKGTGQGLALAYGSVVNRHHGSLHFETELGVGTTFFITIPIAGGAQTEA